MFSVYNRVKFFSKFFILVDSEREIIISGAARLNP